MTTAVAKKRKAKRKRGKPKVKAATTPLAVPRLKGGLRGTLGLIPGYDPFRDAGDYTFDEAAAQRAVDFFQKLCRHVKGEWAGQPVILQPWQVAIVANAFGWKRPDGTRRYREVFLYIPRKQGKTLMASCLANCLLFGDGEPGAEVYCVAAAADQARLLWNVAKQQVLTEPILAEDARVYQHAITIPNLGSTFRAISAEASTKHGYNSHGVIIDELHAQPNRELVDVLITSTGARRQPMIVHLTTADFVRESICNEKHDYAVKVRDGTVKDPSFLPVIYEALPEEDWTSRDVWRRVNPNLGVTIGIDYLEREFARARATPAYENTFRRLHLNQRVEQENRWLSMEAWKKCAGEGADDPVAWRARMLAEMAGRPCWGGLDLGSTSDLTAFCLLFPQDDGRLVWLPWFWCPAEGAVRKDPEFRQLYETWMRQGFMSRTPGNVADYDLIREDIKAAAERYGLRELAIDRGFQGAQLCTQLMSDGIAVQSFGQGWRSMTAPAKRFEELVISSKFVHGNNPILTWMASNVALKEEKHGAMAPVKPTKNSSLKVDGIIAGVMALGRYIMTDPQGDVSVYETRGIL